MKTRTYTFYSDPGHGWLKVPRKVLNALGIENRITRYSRIRGDYAYLEEDCDGSLFVAVAEKHGISLKIVRKHTDKSSRIRGYESYVVLK